MDALRGIAALVVGTFYAMLVGMAAGFAILGALIVLPFMLLYGFIRTLPESMRR